MRNVSSICVRFLRWTNGVLLVGLLGFVAWGCGNGDEGNPSSVGTPCTNDESCAPRACVDGVCCNNVCQGQCVACTAKKKGHGVDGECGAIVGGTDPNGDCIDGQVCDGNGSCAGISPIGWPCSKETECRSGHCVDGVCCNEKCWGRCMTCTSAKKGGGEEGICGAIAPGTDPDDECTLVCDRSVSCIPITTGNPCRFDEECISGHCVDDICCATACDEPCMTCSAKKKGVGINGTCEFIRFGLDPDDECIGEVTCGGVGECAYFVNGATCSMGAECISGACGDGLCCNTPCIDACMTCGLPDAIGTCMETSPNACPAVCDGPVVFKDAPSIPTGFVHAISVADLNGDGMADLMVSNNEPPKLDIYLRTGDKTFAAPMEYPDLHTRWMASADFNGDGYPDLAMVDGSISNVVQVLLNQGNGTLAGKVGYATTGNPVSLVAADLNGDGKPDLAAVNWNLGGVIVMLNNGNGTFATNTKYPAGQCPAALAAADFNGDGKTDLVATTPCFGGVSVLMNNGNGTFASPITLTTPSSFRSSIVAADINSDGKPDIVVATENELSVLLNNGNGTFAASVNHPSDFYRIVATDLNGDGKIDIAGVSDALSATGVSLNHGDGTFEPASYYDTTDHPTLIATGDINDDGITDLVVGNDSETAPMVHFLQNEGPGIFMANRISPAHTGSYEASVTTADVTGDGKIDLIVAGADASALQLYQIDGLGTLASTGLSSMPGTRLLDVINLDVDGDGDRDIAAFKDGETHNLGVFLNNGQGVFDPMIESVLGVTAVDMVGVHLNGDGFEDLALVTKSLPPTEMRTYLGQGNGKFVLKDVFMFDGWSVAIDAADLNADGRRDLVALYYGQYPAPNIAHVLMNKGDGTLAPSVDNDVGRTPDTLALGDVTGDGLPEIVVTSAVGRSISLLINRGNGTFEQPVVFTGHSDLTKLALVDMTGDGQRDIVIASVVANYRFLKILVKDGTGSFAPSFVVPLSQVFPDGSGPVHTLLAPLDFDTNGKNDLAILYTFGSTGIPSVDSILMTLFNRTVNACYPVP